jgi:phosphate transport system substrate-binding protein
MRVSRVPLLILLVVVALAAPAYASEAVKLDPALTGYSAVSGISGNMSSVGSDTLNNLMTLWAESFNKFYPNVKVQIEGKGSGTAPPALIAGTAQLGPMSREMKGTEVDQFEKKFGYKPIPIRVAVDALAVFVNKDNPAKCLSAEQADAVFSKSRRAGYKEDIKTWGQLGLTGDWAARPISLFGRNSASGTYGFFKEHIMKNGDYKDEVKEQPGSAAVVQGITVDRYAIGYSGIGYSTAGVRAVPLAEKAGATCVEATADNA